MARLRRLRRLPTRALAVFGVLLAAAAVPAVISLSGALVEGHPGRWSALLTALQVAAACVAFAAVLAFEPPRSASPFAYARQLRARFLELQSTYDADFRRRPEGKEKEDDLEVPPEP
ncbi:hypothetical protein Adeh_3256 [Anaeromyxobacter dehalogenans 2CP-C]|uniref:Uncharacterized protein n=1 Tax=Anaeromyxobacter dehalogenans (strain 2CP-C) TaxID=290397 RepID=Q2IEL7_ANADE|nr:hypothetical protein Adeh_3256 [Anaeromyxobacter dehalogenans 2CP-C]